jgi:hypothetical protein
MRRTGEQPGSLSSRHQSSGGGGHSPSFVSHQEPGSARGTAFTWVTAPSLQTTQPVGQAGRRRNPRTDPYRSSGIVRSRRLLRSEGVEPPEEPAAEAETLSVLEPVGR